MIRSENFTGDRKVAAAPEMIKSKVFAQTYSKLSQFLKDRRSLPEFAFQNMPSSSKLDINGNKEVCGSTNTTMNLFPKNVEKQGNVSTSAEKLKSLDLFPLTSSSAAVSTEEPINNMADPRESAITIEEEEPKAKTTTASMTIFYGGRVLVFDDLPEDKAQEIMSLGLAHQGMLSSPSQTQTQTQIQAQAQAQIQTQTQNQIQTQTRTFPDKTAITAESTQGAVPQEQGAGLSDIPIARRGSLHRFMKKRKDRIEANAPYPLHNSSTENHEKYDLNRSFDQRQGQEVELKLFQ